MKKSDKTITLSKEAIGAFLATIGVAVIFCNNAKPKIQSGETVDLSRIISQASRDLLQLKGDQGIHGKQREDYLLLVKDLFETFHQGNRAARLIDEMKNVKH